MNAMALHAKAKNKALEWWPLLKSTYQGWSENNALRLAAALAAYLIISLGPLLVLTVQVVLWFLRNSDNARAQVEGQVTSLMGSGSGGAVRELLSSGSAHGSIWATIFSFLVLALSASGVFVELQNSLNTIWNVKPKPNLGILTTVKNRILSIGMVFTLAFLLLVSMFVTTLLSTTINRVMGISPSPAAKVDKAAQASAPTQANSGQTPPAAAAPQQEEKKEEQGWIAKSVAYTIDFVISALVVWALLMMVYRFLPDVRIAFRDVWLGGLFTAILFKIGQIGLAFYFHYGSTASASGAAGSLIAVLLWAYYSAAILFFGAEFTQAYARAHGRRIVPDKDAVPVTEDERARQGIPSGANVVAAAEGKAPPIPPEATRYAGMPRKGSYIYPPRPLVLQNPKMTRVGLADYLFAAGGAAVGAIGAWYAARHFGKADPRNATAVGLNQRIQMIERKVGGLSGLRHLAQEQDLSQRVKRLQQQVIRARSVLRAPQNHRPSWLVRLGDKIAGNR